MLALCYTLNMDCEYSEESFYAVGDINTCTVGNLTVRKPDQILESVNGDKKSKKGDVQGLLIDNQTCHYFPQKIATFMPNLKAISIVNSNLRTITKFDLAPFTQLLRFALNGNRLEYIEGDVFSLNTKLQSVTLVDENLMVINGDILDPLTHLYHVVFDLQCIVDECEYTGCVQELSYRFQDKCVFDSLYPGFTKYFKGMKRAAESCQRVDGDS